MPENRIPIQFTESPHPPEGVANQEKDQNIKSYKKTSRKWESEIG